MRTSAWVVLAIASAPLAAQRPPVIAPPPGSVPAPTSAVRPADVQVTVEGCLFGTQLRLMEGPSGAHEQALRASEFLLEGSKELLRQLARDHDGHQEIITGIAIVPPQPAGEVIDTRTKQIGGVRVTGGVRRTGRAGMPKVVAPADVPRPVRIRVQSATHVAEGCVSRR
jgi:hypothetical protein